MITPLLPEMSLDEFVRKTIVEITKGVADASKEVQALGGETNPRPYGEGAELAQAGFVRARGSGTITYIDFDIETQAEGVNPLVAAEAEVRSGYCLALPLACSDQRVDPLGLNPPRIEPYFWIFMCLFLSLVVSVATHTPATPMRIGSLYREQPVSPGTSTLFWSAA